MAIPMIELVLQVFKKIGVNLEFRDIEVIHIVNKKLWIMMNSSVFNIIANRYDKVEFTRVANETMKRHKDEFASQLNEELSDVIVAFIDIASNRTEIPMARHSSPEQGHEQVESTQKYAQQKEKDRGGGADMQMQSQKQKRMEKHNVLGAKNIIAICSGKGGVGKSTVTVALAKGLKSLGYHIGIVDVDVYGASIPLIMDIEGQPELHNELFIPVEKDGIQVMSVSMLTDEALLWRGPMAVKMLHTLLYQTEWGKNRWGNKNGVFGKKSLDFLLIDTPPGTGDIHLSLTSNYSISGAIMVTTPCKIAMAQTAKSISLMKRMGVNIFGLIENMREDRKMEIEDHTDLASSLNTKAHDVQEWAEKKQEVLWLGHIYKGMAERDALVIAKKIAG